jgi:hypothetical protein
MATQYSNKPIVTDGLVYALDFGNQKSYVSGSVTANSLIYRPTPAKFETLLPGDYGTPAAAYSVRKVVSSYTGDAMMVQSASVSQSIGFDADGNLDTASLASFAGSGDAFVKIWYDQSGNNNHASQSVFANQPRIVNSGAIILNELKPAIEQTGSQLFNVNNVIFTDLFVVLKVNTQATINYFIGQSTGGLFANGTFGGVNGLGGADNLGNVRSSDGEDFNRHLGYFNMSSGKLNISKDGSVLSNVGNFASSMTLIRLLGQTGGPLTLLGNAQEFIFYNSNQSSNRLKIEDNINRYFNIFTPTLTPIPNLDNDFLDFTDESVLRTQQSFPGFSYDQGNSTVMYVGETKGNSSLFTQDGTLSVVSTTSSVGFGSPSNTFGRSYPVTGLKHVALRFSSGSVDCFVNGVPVSASAIFPTGSSIGGGQLNIPIYTGSLGLFQVYNRPLTSDEIWNNYQLTAPRYGLGPLQNKPYTLDENAYLFLQSVGITDPIITGSIDTFVRGLKSASLWDKMIAIYPFVGTGSTGINLTGSHRWNLKEPSLVTYPLTFTGSWIGSTSGSAPSGSGTNITMGGVTPTTVYPNLATSSVHISILSYDTPVSSSYLMGTGMTEDLAVSTLAGDYGTPAAAYSVRKVRTAYSGALMDVRRSIDNVTSSIGYVSNGDLDTGSLLTFVGTGPDDHGFVARWYDQSGNNRHATQTATGSQPLIVLSGSVFTEPTSSKPALRFDGVDDWLRNSTIPGIAGSTPVSIFTIGRPFSVTPYPYLYDIGSQDIILYYPPNKHTLYRGNDLATSANATINTTYLYNLLYNDTNSELKVNGSTTTGSVGTLATSGQITLGAEGGSTPTGGTYFSGSIPEFILYTSNMGGNREPIEYNINNYYNIYPQTSSFATSSFTIKADSGSISGSLNNRLTSGIVASGPLGLITVSRTGSNSLTIARNGLTSSFAVPASGALSTGLHLGAINNNGLALGNSPLNISFASVGTGLTNSETTALYNLVGVLNLNLRKIASDADAYNFLSTASVSGIPEQIAINTLVTDLKSYGVWNKMKAIYPMVGGTADSHKFNLKDPRDTNDAFRLAFSGSWIHSSTGAKPDGSAGTYADTYLNASTRLTNRDVHISYYARAGGAGFETTMIGTTGFGGATIGQIQYNVYGGNKIYSTLGGSRIDITVGSFLVFHTLTSLDGSTNGMRAYTNGVLRGTVTNNSSGLPNATLILANGYLPSSQECAFASIGDGLTDTEAVNFYTAVQKFQTILGRQV